MEERLRTGSDAAIIVTDLSKAYGSVAAVDHLDVAIDAGEIYGLIGPNGAGKTTLIKMLVGILRPDSGNALVRGHSPSDPVVKSQIGYMPQETAVYPDLTVRENLRFFADVYGLERKDTEDRVRRVISLIDLAGKADAVASELSGGMRHRLSLACSLLHDPLLLFLDEPTVGVDPELRVSFWAYFKDLAKEGKTILISTHYMDEAANCTRIGMMHLGRIIADGEPARLVEQASQSNLEDAFLHYSREAARKGTSE
jgi:ABC-2 type transport system ATP-binding protein